MVIRSTVVRSGGCRGRAGSNLRIERQRNIFNYLHGRAVLEAPRKYVQIDTQSICWWTGDPHGSKSMAQSQAQNLESFDQPRDREAEQRRVPLSGPERKRRMSEIIARIAERDRKILAQLAK